jgi:hypothetical protein
MNPTDTSAGGYRDSDMRKYLLNDTVDGAGRISFLAGLKNAGVPQAVLWVPKRYVSARGIYTQAAAPALIEDVLWLPTVREMFEAVPEFYLIADEETAENQARLEYYDSEAKLIKWVSVLGGSYNYIAYYWNGGSVFPGSSSWFYTVHAGTVAVSTAEGPGGCAPAFCVR